MIIDVLIEILKCVSPNVNISDKDITERLLTEKGIALTPVEMYRFLMCVENHFKVYFTSEEVEKWGMRSLRDFETALRNKMVSN